MKKLEELEGEEAKQAIKDWETIPVEDFFKKYKSNLSKNYVIRTDKIIDKLKKKVSA